MDPDALPPSSRMPLFFSISFLRCSRMEYSSLLLHITACYSILLQSSYRYTQSLKSPHKHTSAHIHTFTPTRTNAQTHTHSLSLSLSHTHTNIHINTHTRAHTHTNTFMSTQTHALASTHTHTHSTDIFAEEQRNIHMLTHKHKNVYTHAHIHTHTHEPAHTRTHKHERTFIHTHTPTHIHTHTQDIFAEERRTLPQQVVDKTGTAGQHTTTHWTRTATPVQHNSTEAPRKNAEIDL